MTTDPVIRQRPRIVIVGAGFGGLAAAQALAGAPVDVTVIDRRNYHLFQPLLYQVATAGLSPADIAWPIRGILRRQANASVQLGRLTGIDAERQEVLIGEWRLAYDYLILATGARHAYFEHPEWEATAPGLKKIADATHIRERILMAFERAEAEDCDPDERVRLKVNADFSVPDRANVFAIGDTALALGADGRALPGVAPVAKQAGRYVAAVIRSRIEGRPAPRVFRYRDFGSLSTIGRKVAVADFGKVRLSGFIAWLLWSLAHIYFLIGLRNRFMVALTWLWNYVTFQRGARLITGGESDDPPAPADAPPIGKQRAG